MQKQKQKPYRMARILISKPVAQCLHDAIVRKHEKLTSQSSSSSNPNYGFNNSVSEPSIRNAIVDHVRAFYLKTGQIETTEHLTTGFNGKHLYDLVYSRFDKKKTIAGVDSRYLHCYLLFISQDTSLFEKGFDENLEAILVGVLRSFEEISEEDLQVQIGLLKQRQKTESSRALLYRCTYFNSGGKEFRSFLSEIYPEENEIRIKRTPLGHTFTGDIRPNYPVITSITMENEDKHNRRIVHIILTTGNIPFYDRELSLGVFISVDNDTRPSGGAIAFEKLPSDFNKDQALEIPVPIRFFLRNHDYTMEETDVSTLKQLEQSMLEKFPVMNSTSQQMRQLAGAYCCYAISRTRRLLLVYFNIQENGNVEFKRSNHTTYFGELSLHYPALAIIRTETSNRQSKYHTVLSMPDFGPYEFLEGVYSGIDSHSNPKAGRCLFRKLPDGTVFENLEPAEVALKSSAEHQSILKAYPGFNKFFSSQGEDFFIEDSKLLARDDIFDIEFPKGSREKLPQIEGVYTYLRTSTFDGNMVKEYPISIDKDGYVLVAGKFLSNGKAHIYGDLLYIHLFHNETRFSGRPDADSLGMPDYDGLAIFKIPPAKQPPEYLSGVYVSSNYDQYPVCGRIVLVRSKESFNRLSPQVFKFSKRDFEVLNARTSNLGHFLVGPNDNFIKLSQQQVENTSRASFQRNFELSRNLFYAACFLAKEKRGEEALDTLQKALEYGFDDETLLYAEMKKSFRTLESEVLSLWNRRRGVLG